MGRRAAAVLVLCLGIAGACHEPSSDDASAKLPMDELTAIAIRSSACTGQYVGGFEVLAAHASPGEAYREALGCQSKSSDCHEYLKCWGVDTARRCSDSDDGSCEDAHTVSTCYPVSPTLRFARRIACDQSGGPNNLCAYAFDPYPGMDECVVGPCEARDWRCEGDQMVRCGQQAWIFDPPYLETRVDCSSTGQTCVRSVRDEGEPGGVVMVSVSCVSTADACASGRCHDGTWLGNCSSPRPESDFNCAWLHPDFSCQPDEDDARAASCGVSEVDEQCVPGRSVCDGDVARYCLAGRWFYFDCSSFWDARCVAYTDGGARCVSKAWESFLSSAENG